MALFTRNYTGTIDGKNAWSYCLNNKDENYKDNIEYDVTSWDDVIDHFVDEIE